MSRVSYTYLTHIFPPRYFQQDSLQQNQTVYLTSLALGLSTVLPCQSIKGQFIEKLFQIRIIE
jgi:hypothetical protein